MNNAMYEAGPQQTVVDHYKAEHPEAYDLLENPESDLHDDQKGLNELCVTRGVTPVDVVGAGVGATKSYPLALLREFYAEGH